MIARIPMPNLRLCRLEVMLWNGMDIVWAFFNQDLNRCYFKVRISGCHGIVWLRWWCDHCSRHSSWATWWSIVGCAGGCDLIAPKGYFFGGMNGFLFTVFRNAVYSVLWHISCLERVHVERLKFLNPFFFTLFLNAVLRGSWDISCLECVHVDRLELFESCLVHIVPWYGPEGLMVHAGVCRGLVFNLFGMIVDHTFRGVGAVILDPRQWRCTIFGCQQVSSLRKTTLI